MLKNVFWKFFLQQWCPLFLQFFQTIKFLSHFLSKSLWYCNNIVYFSLTITKNKKSHSVRLCKNQFITLKLFCINNLVKQVRVYYFTYSHFYMYSLFKFTFFIIILAYLFKSSFLLLFIFTHFSEKSPIRGKIIENVLSEGQTFYSSTALKEDKLDFIWVWSYLNALTRGARGGVSPADVKSRLTCAGGGGSGHLWSAHGLFWSQDSPGGASGWHLLSPKLQRGLYRPVLLSRLMIRN